LTAEGKDC